MINQYRSKKLKNINDLTKKYSSRRLCIVTLIELLVVIFNYRTALQHFSCQRSAKAKDSPRCPYAPATCGNWCRGHSLQRRLQLFKSILPENVRDRLPRFSNQVLCGGQSNTSRLIALAGQLQYKQRDLLLPGRPDFFLWKTGQKHLGGYSKHFSTCNDPTYSPGSVFPPYNLATSSRTGDGMSAVDFLSPAQECGDSLPHPMRMGIR
jgi:hypothetical protein